jgi:hypothetical protein
MFQTISRPCTVTAEEAEKKKEPRGRTNLESHLLRFAFFLLR